MAQISRLEQDGNMQFGQNASKTICNCANLQLCTFIRFRVKKDVVCGVQFAKIITRESNDSVFAKINTRETKKNIKKSRKLYSNNLVSRASPRRKKVKITQYAIFEMIQNRRISIHVNQCSLRKQSTITSSKIQLDDKEVNRFV